MHAPRDSHAHPAPAASRAVVVFARLPQLGAVKPRLAASVGPAAALAAYRELGARVVQTARTLPDCRVIVACAPAVDDDLLREWLGDVECEPQAAGGAGPRLAAAAERRFADGARRVALLGTDTLGLDAASLEAAFEALDAADVAIGPSEDGGYWLIALRAPAPALFEGIPWDTPAEVLTTTLQRATTAGLRVRLLARKRDVETVEDWRAWQRTTPRPDASATDASPHAPADG